MAFSPDIKTERLTLISITPEVIRECFKSKSTEEIREFFGTDEAAYGKLKWMYENGLETYRISFHYFLLRDDNADIIGECGFHTWNKTHDRAELFYNLKNDSYKRRGIISEALTEVLKFGFDFLKLHRVEALTADWNEASIAVLKKLGFTKEGTMREDYLVDGKYEDSQCYSLLKWEWEK